MVIGRKGGRDERKEEMMKIWTLVGRREEVFIGRTDRGDDESKETSLVL